MKHNLWSLLASLVVLASVPGTAQTPRPNFSGTWIQNMLKSSVQGSSVVAYTNKIEQTGDTLKVVTILRRPQGDTTSERTYVVGKESRQQGPMGVPLVTRVAWDGPVLVFDTTPEQEGISADVHETWTLSADGKVLTKVRRSHTPLGDNDQTYVLDKQ